MVEAILEHGYILKKAITSISNLLDVVICEFNDTGITLAGMDDAKVSFVVLKLNRDAFILYTVANTTPLAFDMEKLSKIMEVVKDDDRIIITVTMTALATTMGFSFKNDSKNASIFYRLRCY